MTDADYKTTWVQALIDEQHGPKRLSYAEIARRAGVSKQYLGQVKDGAPPSDRLIDGLCEAFKVEPPKPPAGRRIVDPVKAPTEGRSSTEAELVRMVHDLTAANGSLREELSAMRTTMNTQGHYLNLLSETVGVYKEALARLEQKIDALPGRLKIAR